MYSATYNIISPLPQLIISNQEALCPLAEQLETVAKIFGVSINTLIFLSIADFTRQCGTEKAITWQIIMLCHSADIYDNAFRYAKYFENRLTPYHHEFNGAHGSLRPALDQLSA